MDDTNANEDAAILTAALLWLRNHYDINDQSLPLREKVLARVDAVLSNYEPSVVGMGLFRKKFPTHAKGETAKRLAAPTRERRTKQ